MLKRLLLLILITAIYTTVYAQLTVNGYMEAVNSTRLSNSGPVDDQILLQEARIMLEHQQYGDGGEELSIRLLAGHHRLDGPRLEIREAKITIPVGFSWEFSAGRQVLSWGPAQYEFVNDRFAKDYRSFFLGRDMEFLKAPNNIIRVSWFPGQTSVELIWMPQFDPNLGGEGQFIPVFDPEQRVLAAGEDVPDVTKPKSDLENGELHFRIRRLVKRWEMAAYGYRGFTGLPEGFENGMYFYPEMIAAGISARGPVFNGTGWMETAYEDIRDSRAGKLPAVSPDRLTGLFGYQARPTPDTRIMVQAMLTRALDARKLRSILNETGRENDSVWSEENRYFLQLAATRSFLDERMDVTLRGFWGITDQDGHVRLEIKYEWSDAVNLFAGFHAFEANYPSSRFGAVDKHDLIFLRVRYGF